MKEIYFKKISHGETFQAAEVSPFVLGGAFQIRSENSLQAVAGLVWSEVAPA